MNHRPAALVTGSAHRLGREFALALADKGYDIALHYFSSKEKAASTQQEISDLGVRCDLYAADLTHTEGLHALVERVAADMPGLSLLVNSASAYAPANIKDSSPDLFQQQLKVNLLAPIELTRQFARLVSSDVAASVVNIIDNKVAYQQYPYAAYLLSKKALQEFTLMSAMEYAPKIRINGISPGVVLPASVRSEDYLQWRIEGIPVAHSGRPENLCQALFYLLDNDFVTGQILTVDGGESCWLEGRHSENYAGSI